MAARDLSLSLSFSQTHTHTHHSPAFVTTATTAELLRPLSCCFCATGFYCVFPGARLRCVAVKVCFSSYRVCQARFFKYDKHADQPPERTCSSFPSKLLFSHWPVAWFPRCDVQSSFPKQVVNFWLQQSRLVRCFDAEIHYQSLMCYSVSCLWPANACILPTKLYMGLIALTCSSLLCFSPCCPKKAVYVSVTSNNLIKNTFLLCMCLTVTFLNEIVVFKVYLT